MALRIAALVAVLVAVLAWALWPAPTEEDRVRAVVRGVVAGAEAGDVGDVLVFVSDRFTGDEGLDKGTLKTVLQAQFLRRGPITVIVGDIPVTIQGNTAHASFDALLAEGSHQWTDILPVSVDGWHFETDFVLEADDTWRVTHAERTDLTGP